MADNRIPPPNHRLWIPFSIAGLALVGIAVVWLKSDLERNFKSWVLLAVVVLTAVLEFLWFLFLSRFKWRLRLATCGVVALVAFGLVKMLRVDGTVNGTGLPRLVWRWEKPRAPLPGMAPLATVQPRMEPASRVERPAVLWSKSRWDRYKRQVEP